MALTEADFMTALHGYIVAVTGLDGGVVFRGNQSARIVFTRLLLDNDAGQTFIILTRKACLTIKTARTA